MGPIEAEGFEPKKLTGEEPSILEQMEEAVKNCLHGENSDKVLVLIIEMVIASIQSERPLFPSLLEEPVFYRRYLRKWVEEELELEQAMLKKQEADIKALYGM
jgi:hypothetical protein